MENIDTMTRRALLQSAALTALSSGMTVRCHAAPGDIPMTGTVNPALGSFDEVMSAFMTKRAVPGGSLAVVKDGRLVYARGYGLTDKDSGERVTPTSLFRIASISKPITAVAIMTLIQNPRYRLRLNTRVFPLLGITPHHEAGAQADPRLGDITVQHLLQHTAGWDRDKSGDPMFLPLQIAHAVGAPAPADQHAIIRYMLGRPLDFTPGARFAYSNFGYCVLGRVIEKVTGQPYEAYVQRSVLAPLSVRHMAQGRTLRALRRENEVCYYQPGATAKSVFPEAHGEQVSWCYGGFHLEAMDSHGAWLASAVDLVRFAAGLDAPQGRPLLNDGTTQSLYARPEGQAGEDTNGKPSAAYYGDGWFVRPVGGQAAARRNIWHGGSLPGTNTLLVRRWDGLTWAALFNQRSEGDMPPDSEIDGALHRAADAVKTWPAENLFAVYR